MYFITELFHIPSGIFHKFCKEFIFFYYLFSGKPCNLCYLWDNRRNNAAVNIIIGDAVDVENLEPLGILNLHSVFGRGVRGETLARGCHMVSAIDRLGAVGVTIVVDLRTAWCRFITKRKVL